MKYILNNDNLEVVGKQYLQGVGGYDGTNPDTSSDIATYLPNMVNITYLDLKNLREVGKLVPGQQYRITDYITTTIQENTQSAGHQFDLIVTASNESTLNEVARAIQHDGDTYFADSDLNAWQLWYCLDNDTSRFAWADATNGKGVIYRMIDEFGNDCPYDFKNMQFKHPKDTTTYPDYYYTFSTVINGSVTDHSMLNGYCFNNIIKEYIETIQLLNPNVFINTDKTSYCYSNKFGNYCYANSFGNNCHSNSFGNYCLVNSFGDNCYSNSFGNYCYSNSFGDDCYNNSFGNNCHSNSFGDNCYNNSFENDCSSNSFGNYWYSNSFGNYCGANSFGDNCYNNSFENDCSSNSFGNYCYSNSFGNECRYNSFRKSNSEDADLRNYCDYNHFDDGCCYNVIWNDNPNTSSLYKLQNINVNRGVVGTHTSFNMINIDVLNSEQEINVNQVDGIISIGNILSIKYESLKTLRDNAQLVPGQQYRITDYVTTTAFVDTQSAGHQFDIIVTADDESTLNEVAKAIQHDGDTYFTNSDLNAWQIWYCFDNDTHKFAWEDIENGKGIIYHMIDERGNDCPYDFKNIQFKHPNDTTIYPDYYYTFSAVIDGVVTDYSLSNSRCFNNIIKEHIVTAIQQLNNNVFINTNNETSNCYNNSFGNGCYNNSFGDSCYNNVFGNSCFINSFGSQCYNNVFGNGCYNNVFGHVCYNNVFGNVCYNNSFGNGCFINSFGNVCYNNSFGNGCQFNSFGNNCYLNSFRMSNSTDAYLRDYCLYNHFDDGCSYNVIWNDNPNTSSSYTLRNININRGVVGTHTSFNMINIDVLNSEQEINVNQVDGIISIGNILSIKYESLKTLRDNSQLISGRQYRITDYITTTTQANTQSAGHPFDVIVLALSESELSEQAWACHSERDTDGYFANSELSAWQVWYCLDNDTSRFAWADTANGKGIIYRMIDEWNNDCPYDFKNIQFKHPNDTETYPDYYYTFTNLIDGAISDKSMVEGYCFGNVMGAWVSSKVQKLNGNVFVATSKSSSCYSNSFGNNCSYNSFGNSCVSNSFGNNCSSNSFWNNCSSNSFGNNCYSNSFGNNCYSNSFGNNCSYNSFGNSCASNSFGNNCYSNSFGNNCYSNSFGNSCSSNSFGNSCSSNSFGNNCAYNSFGNSCSYNSFGNSCAYNSFGNSCSSNSFRSSDTYEFNWDVEINMPSGTLLNYVRNNHFGDGSSLVIVHTGTLSSVKCIQNLDIAQRLKSTETEYIDDVGYAVAVPLFVTIATSGQEYEIKVARNTSGEVKVFTLADIIA